MFALSSFCQRCALLLAASLVSVGTAWCDEPASAAEDIYVKVCLSNGSKISAVADATTNQDWLVLRFTAPGVLLLRKIAWSQIEVAVLADQQVSPAELKAHLTAARLDRGDVAQQSQLMAGTLGLANSIGRAAGQAALLAAQATEQKPVSLEVYSDVANWDSDAAVDGVRVVVRPLSANGELVPVDGSVTVKLFGLAFQPAGGVRQARPLDEYPEIVERTLQVRQQDFGPLGAVYRLEFQQIHPEFQLNLSAYGLLTARLSVPGSGVFEASDATASVRPYSPYRDWYQQGTGSRFLPDENIVKQ